MQFTSAFDLNIELHLHFAIRLSSRIQFITAYQFAFSMESNIQNLPDNFHIKAEHFASNPQN